MPSAQILLHFRFNNSVMKAEGKTQTYNNVFAVLLKGSFQKEANVKNKSCLSLERERILHLTDRERVRWIHELWSYRHNSMHGANHCKC
jgi:hypothetical protein